MPQITTKEASRILGISKRTLFRWEQERRIKSTREGILNIRVYDRQYITMVKKLLDLDKRIRKHNTKLPEILVQIRKHQLEQVYNPGRPLKLFSSSDLKSMGKAFDDEEAWDAEHKRQIIELGQLLQEFRTKFPDAPLKELLLKEEKNK